MQELRYDFDSEICQEKGGSLLEPNNTTFGHDRIEYAGSITLLPTGRSAEKSALTRKSFIPRIVTNPVPAKHCM